MKKLIVILFTTVIIFAQQENQSQSIELPDFVITGNQQIDLPVMKKSKAEPVSLLSKEFFFPTFSPEQFSMATVAKPRQLIADFLTSNKNFNNQLILGAGQYTLPTGEFYLSHRFDSGKLYSKLWGLNRRDYVDYADFNLSGINAGAEFYINKESEFLPGTIINVEGEFVRKEYNFYSSLFSNSVTSPNRETQNIVGKVSLENYYGDILDYKFGFVTDFLDIKDASATEMNLIFSGVARVDLGAVSLVLNGKIHSQSLSKISDDDNYSYYKVKAGLEYRPNHNLILRGGAAFYSAETKSLLSGNQALENVKEDLITPWAETELSFNNNLSLSASYNPTIDFKTYSDYLKINPYVYVNTMNGFNLGFDNGTTVTNHKFTVAIKYGYKKYYELSLGASYFLADDYTYFNSNVAVGSQSMNSYSFKIDKVDKATGYSIYANALYHLGPFGWLYSDAKYEVVESDDNFTNKTVTLPYNPKVSFKAVYGYNFAFGLSTEIKLDYLKDTYADIYNDIKLSDYINLSAMLRYSLSQNFDFTLHLNNLLNRDNYLWLGYLETPFDFTAGIDFRF